MDSKSRLLLQIMMWFVSAAHLIIGVGVNVSPQFIEIAARAYGTEPQAWSPEFLHILKPLGAFMIALGVIAAFAAHGPERYRAVVYVFAGLFMIRALHRLVFTREITEAFGISPERSMGNMVFFFGMAIVLVALDQLAHRTRRGTPAATEGPAMRERETGSAP